MAFIDPPRRRRTEQQAGQAMRPTAEHDPGCIEPAWVVQQSIYPTRRVLARCAGCSAVTVQRRDEDHR